MSEALGAHLICRKNIFKENENNDFYANVNKPKIKEYGPIKSRFDAYILK